MFVLNQIIAYLDFRRFSREQQIHLLINCFVGIVIFVGSIIVEESTWGRKNVNLQFDAFIWQEAYQIENQHDVRVSPDVIFFDIDDATYQKWGRPSLTPRDKVAQLMEFAYQGGARVIVSDINFEEFDYTPAQSLEAGELALSGEQRDQRLRQVLTNIKHFGGDTKVILPAIFYADKTLRRNIFEDLIDDHVIFRAVPISEQDDYDAVTRYWLPFQECVNKKGEQATLWSSPLLAVLLAHGSEIDELKEKQETILQHCEEEHKPYLMTLKESGKTINVFTEPGSQYNRIRFLLLPENVLTSRGTLYAVNQRKTSSGPEVFTTTNPKFSLKGKIVIIGNSSPDSHDTHMTPVGYMPGMYIQGNVINTLLQNNNISIIHPAFRLLAEGILIVLASYIFLYFHSFTAQLLLSCFLICLLPVLYYLFLQTGVFFDLAFPLAGIGVHELFAKIEHLLMKGKRHHSL